MSDIILLMFNYLAALVALLLHDKFLVVLEDKRDSREEMHSDRRTPYTLYICDINSTILQYQRATTDNE